MEIKLKRAYDKADESDGCRILVDRLWPRGLSKDKIKINLWLKEIAPSAPLCKWFAHDVAKWSEFRQRYFTELTAKEELVSQIVEKAATETVTLVYAAHDTLHNNAVVLQEYIDRVRET